MVPPGWNSVQMLVSLWNFWHPNINQNSSLITKQRINPKNDNRRWAMVVHAFNPSTWEAEAGRYLSLGPAWSWEWVPGQPGLHRETLSQTSQKNKQKKRMTIGSRALPFLVYGLWYSLTSSWTVSCFCLDTSLYDKFVIIHVYNQCILFTFL